MNMVYMFFTRNMMAHLVHWSLVWFDTYMYSRKKLWICDRQLQDYPQKSHILTTEIWQPFV